MCIRDRYEAFAKELKAYEKVIKAEYAGIEDAVSIKLKECEAPKERIAADAVSYTHLDVYKRQP